MSTTCKYCNEAEDKQNRPGLLCYGCMNFVHLTCLRRPGTPGDFACDVFFEFTCESCSPDNYESFTRFKIPWVNVIYLTLNHLCTQSYGISHHGYFHYKTHICSFIDRHWQALFGASNKQKKNWVGTIAGALSVYSKLFFKSGSTVLGETGWWRLLHNFSPAVAAHIIQEMARDKPKNRPRNQQAMDRHHFVAKICEMGYKDLIKPDIDEALELEPAVPCKKKRVDSADSAVSGASYFDHVDSDSGRYEIEDQSYSDSLLLPSGEYSMPHELDLKEFEYSCTSKLMQVQSDTSSVHSFNQNSAPYYDSDSRSGSDHDKKPVLEKLKKTTEEKTMFRKESLFSTQLNSEDLPWEDSFDRESDTTVSHGWFSRHYEKENCFLDEQSTGQSIHHPEHCGELYDISALEMLCGKGDKETKQKLVELSQYEEIQLLKRVEGLAARVKEPSKRAYLHRLRAKLVLRRLKRHKHLPIFDLDKTVKILGGYVTEDPTEVINTERVLDRFQRSYLMDNLCGTICRPQTGTTLLSRLSLAPLRSTYSGTLLRPYIRRDRASNPTWLALTDELLRRTHRHVKEYQPPPRATIDYSYVRPEHIAAVNSMCAQFFWPGIDLTEALQYPEFSCVASYKRLAVGCAFLVPDSNPNEGYISFIVTRPEWRRAGIATFMLYHLLQTCTGKDVTLHCSPTNPAIFLYQKFGFKVEELVQDFYEKYFDIEYKGCRHALFLRLSR